MKKKKVRFWDLKTGRKFRFQGRLYIKDSYEMATSLTSGECLAGLTKDLVTPVKIKITIL